MIIPGQALKPLVKLPRDPSGCWQWIGFIKPDSGVAMKVTGGRMVPARRWMWEQLFGPIPKGYVIAQECGNQSCVNPYHLAKMTLAEANRKGMAAKITAADAEAIRMELKTYQESRNGKSVRSSVLARKLAHEYGISHQSVRDIWRGDTWKRKTKHATAITPSEKVEA